MKLRFPRPQVRCSILFSADYSGAGTVHNISEKGCKVVCDKTVSEGAELTLRISAFEQESPINIDQAVVRWSKRREFGVEFTGMRREARERLSQLVKVLERSSRR